MFVNHRTRRFALNPSETLSSDAVWEDSRLPSVRETPSLQSGGALSNDFVNIKDNADTVTTTQPSNPAETLLPATGWVFNNQGEVTLIAQAPNATPYNLRSNPTTCRVR